MRKSAAIAIMTIYGILSIGVQVHLHYCCGKLADINLFSSGHCAGENDAEHGCCEKSNDCCKFEDFSIKIDDTHNPSSFKLALIPPFIAAQTFYTKACDELSLHSFNISLSNSDPPPALPIYLKCHALVFYA